MRNKLSMNDHSAFVSGNRSRYIERNKAGRRLVIPDVHGCSKTLSALLDRMRLTKNDQLFFLGDYIDRGPDSKGVLDIVIKLIEDGYAVYPLMGNHEFELLEFAQNRRVLEHLSKQSKLDGIITSDFSVEDKYYDFIANLHFFLELDRFLLVHAGFDFSKQNPFSECEEMLWIREFELPDDFLRARKTIVHGHTPLTIQKIRTGIKNDEAVIGLDNGCVFKGIRSGFLGLICYDLDSKEIVIQENIDMEKYMRLAP